jgi:hypothetical protein
MNVYVPQDKYISGKDYISMWDVYVMFHVDVKIHGLIASKCTKAEADILHETNVGLQPAMCLFVIVIGQLVTCDIANRYSMANGFGFSVAPLTCKCYSVMHA